MAVRVKVSKKHQIAVPSEVTKQLGIRSGDELLVELRDGYAVVLPPAYSQRLRGLHREVWAGVEAQEYVRQEREAWPAQRRGTRWRCRTASRPFRASTYQADICKERLL